MLFYCLNALKISSEVKTGMPLIVGTIHVGGLYTGIYFFSPFYFHLDSGFLLNSLIRSYFQPSSEMLVLKLLRVYFAALSESLHMSIENIVVEYT